MKHLYLFTVSPVQSFIEQARKTHDLYAGSQILSDLIRQAMKLVIEKSGKDNFIFPTYKQDSKPNRFITIVESDDMQTFGNEIQTAVNDYFIDVLGQKVIELNHSSIFQLEDFLKIYWVAEKYEEKGDYPNQIKQLERNLGAVKNIRHFKQLGEKGRKCSMNGEYNVKFYRKTESETTKNTEVLGDKNKLFHSDAMVIDFQEERQIQVSHLQPGEGLCAVSIMKRFFKAGENFPSTANIALEDTLQKVIKKDEKAKQLIDEFTSCLGKKNEKNGQLYFDENLTSEYFKKQGISQGALDCANKKLNKLVPIIKRENLKLSKYYAILAFDADGMGKKLEKCKGAEEHTRVSKLLADFAKFASNYINEDEKSRGKTVYAGGDDFLGFINLNHLFDVMKHLRNEFDIQVNNHLREDLKMTFSAGVAIAHYKTPLSEVLKWSRQMEKTAKKVLHKTDDSIKKDAFSVAVLKRSGEIHYTTWRWKTFEDKWTINLFQDLIVILKKGHLSKKFITNLSSEYEKRLDNDGNWGDEAKNHGLETELNNMLSHELEFFIKRATATDDEAKKAVKGLSDELYQNYHRHIDFELSVQNFLNMLHICEFVTRELNPIETKEAKQNSEQLQTENA
jgi:CRISPR-associated protein Cmr2